MGGDAMLVKLGHDLYPSEEVCFLCAKPFDGAGTAVTWVGVGARIYLHGEYCAGSFVLRIARDAWQIEHDRDDSSA
ncbi:hypothetical protein B1H29_24300 [Streptomyces pactum]|uniref:Uncharacterized protein n=1 Tax=Streptomyces pactum TaxID=68249 RepID=A0A1S6JCV7_9ACTN|nr:hypothetical protein B1H29_24300 [Streptomyces pactum]